MYLDQLLGAVRTRKLVETLISGVKSLKKVWNEQKMLKNGFKNVSTSFRVTQNPKTGQNTQHLQVLFEINIIFFVKKHELFDIILGKNTF